jgi:hypothetical protein
VKTAGHLSFRFYGALNDFLPPPQRARTFFRPFEQRASIKDVIESIGVPPPEVDLIIASDRSVGFSYLPQPGDRSFDPPRSTGSGSCSTGTLDG